jgi:fructoselysine-6-P-deglycase FrlB-like protein
MSFIGEEIARQPHAWRKAATVATAAGTGLPERGERVAVVGCGTSWFMAEAYAALREQRGFGETASSRSRAPEPRPRSWNCLTACAAVAPPSR